MEQSTKYIKKGASKILDHAPEPKHPEILPQVHAKLKPNQLKAGLQLIQEIQEKLNLLENFLVPPSNPIDFLNATTKNRYYLKQILKIYEDEN